MKALLARFRCAWRAFWSDPYADIERLKSIAQTAQDGLVKAGQEQNECERERFRVQTLLTTAEQTIDVQAQQIVRLEAWVKHVEAALGESQEKGKGLHARQAELLGELDQARVRAELAETATEIAQKERRNALSEVELVKTEARQGHFKPQEIPVSASVLGGKEYVVECRGQDGVTREALRGDARRHQKALEAFVGLRNRPEILACRLVVDGEQKASYPVDEKW